jgi:hypothetical protein
MLRLDGWLTPREGMCAEADVKSGAGGPAAPICLSGTNVIFDSAGGGATVGTVSDGVSRSERVPETKGQRMFYGLFLPLGVLANLGLGLVILTGLNPAGWSGWLQIGTGALCCLIAGWLAAAAWSKFYWYRNMTRQVQTWRRIADAFFTWVEEAPVPAESLHSLKSQLEEAVPTTETR